MAGAQTPGAPPGGGNQPAAEHAYSPYEQDTIGAGLEHVGGSIDPAPQGKSIEHVEVITLDVLERRDPLPRFLNVFHVTTRERIVRRELLFRVGEAYDQARIDESARNLRLLRQLSVVLIVPYRGSVDDRVRVLVITKDVWSLRLNWSVQAGDGGLTSFLVAPSEENLFGTHASFGGLFVLRPDTYSVGGLFRHARLFGSRIQTRLNANVLVNRDTGESEGSSGYVYYGQPLYALDTRWAWSSVVLWNVEIFRRFVGGNQRRFPEGCLENCLPYEFDTNFWYGSYELTRSFGLRDKLDISIGFEAQRGDYSTDPLSGFEPGLVAEFNRQEVPVDDQRLNPFLQLHAHSTRFMRTINLETLGLQEDYQLGHDVWLRVFPASRELGSSRNTLGTFAALGYGVQLGNGLGRVTASHTLEYAGVDETDATLSGALFLATPSLGVGRIVYDAALAYQYLNYLNERFDIGGETRPRGFAVGRFLGDNTLVSSFEFRSAPLEILSAQVAAAVFYDAGDAFDTWDTLVLNQAVGAGIRSLIPWLDRTVFRFDWGVPINDGARWPGSFFISFKQAFPVPQLQAPTPAALIVPQRQQ